jgi:hypothetical protein
MDEFVMRMIEMAPAVGVLIFIIIRQEQRNELLVKTLVDYFENCIDQDGQVIANGRKPTLRGQNERISEKQRRDDKPIVHVAWVNFEGCKLRFIVLNLGEQLLLWYTCLPLHRLSNCSRHGLAHSG